MKTTLKFWALGLAAFAFLSCAPTQSVVNINGFLVKTPSPERLDLSKDDVPPIPSGMDGIDFAVERLYLSKSKKSAFMISSAMVTMGQGGEDFASAYINALQKQLQDYGNVELNERDGNDGIKIASLAFAAGDVVTDKVLVYSLDRPNALMIDFVFSVDEAESLKDDMAALLDSLAVVE